MKTIVCLLVLLLFTTSVRAASPTNEADTVQALAERFVNAVAREDLAAARACWFSSDKLKELAANPPAGIDPRELTEKSLEYTKEQWMKRDAAIAVRFRTLVDGLKKRDLPLSKIQLAELTPKLPGTKNGMAFADNLEVIMKIDDVKIEYRLGDAKQLNGRWYCLEYPGEGATVIRNDRADSIQPEKPTRAGDSEKP